MNNFTDALVLGLVSRVAGEFSMDPASLVYTALSEYLANHPINITSQEVDEFDTNQVLQISNENQFNSITTNQGCGTGRTVV